MIRALPILTLILLLPGTAGALDPPITLSVEAETLGRGIEGSVVGVVILVAPEDRKRLGSRIRLITTLSRDGDIIDRQSAVATLESDGTAMLYKEWPVGVHQLSVELKSMDGPVGGVWIGVVETRESEEAFKAPEGAATDALVLEVMPPTENAVTFKPPPDIGGIGALGLEVEAPETAASVEFFQDGNTLGRLDRAPWTVSVMLGDVIRRTEIRAVAYGAEGRYLGEDALVLNNPAGQIGIQILLGPQSTDPSGDRRVTVSVTRPEKIHEVTIQLDDEMLARWAACPCVIDVSQRKLASAVILSADVVDVEGNRGDQVMTMAGGSGFVGAVRVELIELPVVVLERTGVPVLGLTQDAFTVYEDDVKIAVEGFGTTADLALSLALAVDTSGSMLDIFPQVQSAVTGFANNLLEDGDEAALIRFSWDAKVEVGWTDELRRLTGKLDRFVPDGGTSLNDAVVRSLEQFRGRRGRQALVLLTDGEDTTSRTDWKLVERYARTMRIPIFPIGLGSSKFGGKKILNALARETGGEAFYPKTVEELPAVYARIAELLRSQYLLWYTSDSSKPTEQFREIRVVVDTKGREVRTIRGYYPGK